MSIQIDVGEFQHFVRLSLARGGVGYFMSDETFWMNAMIRDLHMQKERKLYIHNSELKYMLSVVDEWYSFAHPMASSGVRYLVMSDVSIEATVGLMGLYKAGKFKKHVMIGGKW